MSPRVFRRRGVRLKSTAQVAAMRPAGLLVGRTLQLLSQAVRPGVSAAELDALAEEHIRANGGVPSFKGYQGFPASICVSVDEQVVHGIPSDRRLAGGELVSIDCGAIVDGWHGDAAITVPVGSVAEPALALAAACEDALWAGIGAVRVGGRLGDVSAAVAAAVRGAGPYAIVDGYVGHGIGREMHQPPDVPNEGRAGRGLPLVPGLVIAIEPMITSGGSDTRVLADDWTVVSADGAVAAHAEHTVAVTAAGPWVLTALDGGADRLAALGAACGAPADGR